MAAKPAPAITELRLRDLMSTEVVTLSPEDTLRFAVEALVDRRISGAPVVAGNTVVGVLSATDLMEFDAEKARAKAIEHTRRWLASRLRKADIPRSTRRSWL